MRGSRLEGFLLLPILPILPNTPSAVMMWQVRELLYFVELAQGGACKDASALARTTMLRASRVYTIQEKVRRHQCRTTVAIGEF